jgi:hypothetical protein
LRLASAGRPQISSRVQRWASTATASLPQATTPKPSKQSILPRVLAFSTFTLILGGSAGAYTLATDEATLFWARDRFPWLVNAVAPFIGIPQEVSHGELIFKDDDEDTGPTDIKEVVGDSVHIAVKLASGRVQIVQCNAGESARELQARVLHSAGAGDRVVDINSLDPAKAQELGALSPEQLYEKLSSVRIPDIPEVITLYSLGVALELCRQAEVDLEVRLRLTQSESDVVALKRGLGQLDERKKVLKQMIKDEKKRQGIGFLASMFRKY